MTAAVVAHHRRLFGLHRLVYIARCPDCGWRTELRHEHLAAAISRAHVCALQATEVKP